MLQYDVNEYPLLVGATLMIFDEPKMEWRDMVSKEPIPVHSSELLPEFQRGVEEDMNAGLISYENVGAYVQFRAGRVALFREKHGVTLMRVDRRIKQVDLCQDEVLICTDDGEWRSMRSTGYGWETTVLGNLGRRVQFTEDTIMHVVWDGNFDMIHMMDRRTGITKKTEIIYNEHMRIMTAATVLSAFTNHVYDTRFRSRAKIPHVSCDALRVPDKGLVWMKDAQVLLLLSSFLFLKKSSWTCTPIH